MHKCTAENPPGIFSPRKHNCTQSCARSLSLPPRPLLRLSLCRRGSRVVGRGHAGSRSEITSICEPVGFIRLPKADGREVLRRESAFPQRPRAEGTMSPASGFTPSGKGSWPPWSSPGPGGPPGTAAPSRSPRPPTPGVVPGPEAVPAGGKSPGPRPAAPPAAPAPLP